MRAAPQCPRDAPPETDDPGKRKAAENQFVHGEEDMPNLQEEYRPGPAYPKTFKKRRQRIVFQLEKKNNGFSYAGKDNNKESPEKDCYNYAVRQQMVQVHSSGSLKWLLSWSVADFIISAARGD